MKGMTLGSKGQQVVLTRIMPMHILVGVIHSTLSDDQTHNYGRVTRKREASLY